MATDSTTARAVRTVTAEGFVEEDGRTRLVLSVCRTCEARWFPPLEACATCAGTELDRELTGEEGTVYASTVVRVGPPDFPAPYVLSYVDIDGVRLLAHTAADRALAPGTRVRLGTGPIGLAGETVLTSYRVRAADAAEEITTTHRSSI